MSVNQILNVAIVLVAIYALLSTVCSWLHEWIAARLALRGWDLFRGISQLVSSDDLTTALFNHPLINSTSPKPTNKVRQPAPDGVISENGKDTRSARRFLDVLASGPPSYIDARNFSSCFWQIMQTAQVAKATVSTGQWQLAGPAAGGGATSMASSNGSTPTASTAPTAMNTSGQAAVTEAAAGSPSVMVMDGGYAANSGASSAATAPSELQRVAAVADPGKLIVALRDKVAGMQDAPALQSSLLPLLTAAGNDYDKLLRATDGWFNAQMDRVSGWYARRTRTIMCLISFVVVMIIGIDTRQVISFLSVSDPKVLDKIAAGAHMVSGKTGTFDLTQFAHLIWNRPYGDWNSFSTAAPGLALTWLAVWLGGSFWFDLLAQLVNVRAAGRKPERTDQPPR